MYALIFLSRHELVLECEHFGLGKTLHRRLCCGDIKKRESNDGTDRIQIGTLGSISALFSQIQKMGTSPNGEKTSLLNTCDKCSKAAETPSLFGTLTPSGTVKHSCEHKSSQETCLECTQEFLLRLLLHFPPD